MRAHNRRQEQNARNTLAACWQTAAMTGQAFAGKLRPMRNYLRRAAEKSGAPKIGKEEFERRLRAAKEAEANGAAKSQGKI